MTRKTLDPILPGEILWKEFLEPLGISQNKVARDLDVPVTRISDIIHGRRGISAILLVPSCLLWHNSRVLAQSSNAI